MMMTKEDKAKQKSAQINNALGVFIVFFGIVILIATSHTDTYIGEMTNLVAGLILFSIGAGMMIKSWLTLKKLKTSNQD